MFIYNIRLPCVPTESALLQEDLSIQFQVFDRLLNPFHVPTTGRLRFQCKIYEAIATILGPKESIRVLLGARGGHADAHAWHIH